MKDRKIPAVSFPVEVNVMADWNSEIVDDLANPTFQYVWQIKHKVMLSLDMREWEHYMNLKWLDRELYVREKALQIIQK